MEHDLETLEHQTAPESTRGLFDPPEQTRPPPDKRRSFHAFGPVVESARARQQQQQQQQQQQLHHQQQQGGGNRQGSRHQRSQSAITSDMLSNHGGSRRNTNFGLHTLAEEDDSQRRKHPHSHQQQQQQQQQQQESMTVDSLQDMINTLKALPPYSTQENGVAQQQQQQQQQQPPQQQQPGSRRNSRKLSIGPDTNRRLSHNRNSGIDIQSVLPLPSESQKQQRRRSSMRMSQQQPQQPLAIPDDDEMDPLSREAALAEAEAKLMGTFKRDSAKEEVPPPMLTPRPSTSGGRRYSDNGAFEAKQQQRMSLQQLPTVSENAEDMRPSSLSARANRRITFNKPLNLGNDTNKPTASTSNSRRSSRNFEYDWRNSLGSPGMPQFPNSPRSSTYRNSFNLVPFTPTRVNFARDDANPHQRRPLFIAHLPFSALTPLFRSRQLVRGMLRVNKRNRSDAYVSCEDLDADIYVCGSRDRNRALEGDVVAIRLVDVEKVLREKKEKEEAKFVRNGGQVKVRQPDEEDENEIIFGGDDDVDVVKPKYCGVVVAILERAQNQVFSGTLTLMRPNNKRAQEEKAADDAHKAETGQNLKKESPRIVWFKATDKRVPLIAIPIEQAPADFVDNSPNYINRLFVGSIKRWPITSLHPFGTLERELGSIMDLDIQTQAILADNNVTDTEFSEAVQKCLPALPYAITPEDEEGRRVIHDVRVFTLDEANAEVLDDALSIQKLGDDTFEIGVHISDVAHFIKAHSPMDKEARARAARVELVHRSVPILPRELTEQVTNLRPNESKLAFSVIWKLSSAGKVLDTWFGKTVVKSCAELSLDEAQKVLDNTGELSVGDAETKAGLEQDLRMLFQIASELHHARFTDHAMSLKRGELGFQFGGPQEPTQVFTRRALPASVIVKELLLLANHSVAQKVSSQFPEQALLRRHAPPVDRKISELQEYAARYLGVSLDISSAGSLERSVQSIEDANLRKMMSILVLKTMAPPKYFCSGTLDILKYAHFALNAPLFTHFTAPTSRFSDIIVHRQLEAALTGEKRFYLDRDTVHKLAQHCNVKREAALYAREQSVLLWLAVYLSKRGLRPNPESDVIVVRREAIVVAVSDQFFDVMIPDLNLEKRIHLANLPVWRAEFNEHQRELTMYWKKGMDTTTGKQRAWSLSDDEEEEDMDEDALLEEMRADAANGSNGLQPPPQPQRAASDTTAAQPSPVASVTPVPTRSASSTRRPEASRSTGKRASMVHARLSDSTAYSTDQGSQTIKALDKIQVIVTVEMVKTPPLVRILGANPYA